MRTEGSPHGEDKIAALTEELERAHKAWLLVSDELDEWIEAAKYEKDEKLKAWSERNALRLKVNSLEQTVLNLSERLWELGGCPEREAAWPPDDVAADELRKAGL